MILSSVTFLPLFYDLEAGENVRFVYYGVLAGLYCIGWSSVQVSHMSLVPSLTLIRERRVRVFGLRTASTTCAHPSSISLTSSPCAWE